MLGLPPQLPGVPTASLATRQIWWAATVLATGIGIYLITATRLSWLVRMGGIVCLALPHIIGAPVAVVVEAGAKLEETFQEVFGQRNGNRNGGAGSTLAASLEATELLAKLADVPEEKLKAVPALLGK